MVDVTFGFKEDYISYTMTPKIILVAVAKQRHLGIKKERRDIKLIKKCFEKEMPINEIADITNLSLEKINDIMQLIENEKC